MVFDRNSDGIINDGSELFGQNTPLLNGGFADNGFAALAQEDTNGDGIIDFNDLNWSNLKIWQDKNQDGISQSNELFTLDELGITSINIDYQINNTSLSNGNYLYGTGSYTTTDGLTHDLADVVLAQDTFNSRFTEQVLIPIEDKDILWVFP